MPDWLPGIQPELHPPSSVVPVPSSAIHLGWRRALEVDWRIDAVLVGATTEVGERHLPAVVVSPLVHYALDEARACAEFERWKEDATTARRDPLNSGAVPALDDVLMRPLIGPVRRSQPIEATSDLWDHRTAIVEQAEALLHGLHVHDSDDWDIEELLVDYPFVTLTLPSAKRLWDPKRWRVPPSKADSLDRVLPPSSLGPARRVKLPHLAVDLHAVLPDARTLQSARWRQLSDRYGPLKARWAIETALDLGDPTEPPEVMEVENWLNGVKVGEDGDRLAAGARALSRFISNRKVQLRQGRSKGKGMREVRRIVAYVCPDLSVFPRQLTAEELESAQARDQTLVDWIRSTAFVRMMAAVSAREPETLTMRSSDGTLATFLAERGLPFTRQRLTFDTGNPHYRGAVAMVPGAQPRGAVTVDITGFGHAARQEQLARLGSARPDRQQRLTQVNKGEVAMTIAEGAALLGVPV